VKAGPGAGGRGGGIARGAWRWDGFPVFGLPVLLIGVGEVNPARADELEVFVVSGRL
jgi:hypothetical protein